MIKNTLFFYCLYGVFCACQASKPDSSMTDLAEEDEERALRALSASGSDTTLRAFPDGALGANAGAMLDTVTETIVSAALKTQPTESRASEDECRAALKKSNCTLVFQTIKNKTMMVPQRGSRVMPMGTKANGAKARCARASSDRETANDKMAIYEQVTCSHGALTVPQIRK